MSVLVVVLEGAKGDLDLLGDDRRIGLARIGRGGIDDRPVGASEPVPDVNGDGHVIVGVGDDRRGIQVDLDLLVELGGEDERGAVVRPLDPDADVVEVGVGGDEGGVGRIGTWPPNIELDLTVSPRRNLGSDRAGDRLGGFLLPRVGWL